jgi:TPP-dependent pyruvate/acetoin dehydrogenase alpha subunit
MKTVKELQQFEKEIADIYSEGKIRGPIHLRDGNEAALKEVFRTELIRPTDYVFATWSSHLEALLHGVPRELVKERILAGSSITLSFPEYNFFSSAIVGGVCPIAVGTAWAIKRTTPKRIPSRHVFVFIGDMTAMAGVFSESLRYSENFDLPIKFIVGDNGKSVGTPTDAAWGETCEDYITRLNSRKIIYYKYKLTYPHAGVGKFISF